MIRLKIIFLDIDGTLKKFHDKKLNTKSIELLNELIEKTGAKIVVSSTWRHNGIDFVKNKLSEIKGDIIDITPVFTIKKAWGPSFDSNKSIEVPRGLEINEWIRENTTMEQCIENYVIIDDSEDMLYYQREHFVKVDQTKAFNEKNLKESIKILNDIYTT